MDQLRINGVISINRVV